MNADTAAMPAPRPALPARLARLYTGADAALAWLKAPVDLLVRLWVAQAFFASGLTKIASFDSTVLLFTYEYHVPLLPPEVAAVLGTAAELALPVLLALGLFGRLTPLALFVFNIVAVISYPDLMEAGLHEHMVWGLLLLVTIAHGPGALSADRLLVPWIARRWPR